MDIQIGSRVAIASGKNAGLEYEVLDIQGGKATVRSLRTNATGTAKLNNLLPVENTITPSSIDAHLSTFPDDSPESSPEVSPATGKDLDNGSNSHGSGVSLSTADTPGHYSAMVPVPVPDDVPGYRGKLLEHIDGAIATLERRALVGAWIATRTRGDRTYYALRRVGSGGEELPEQVLKFGELEKFRQRCNEGKILVRLRELRSLLLEED